MRDYENDQPDARRQPNARRKLPLHTAIGAVGRRAPVIGGSCADSHVAAFTAGTGDAVGFAEYLSRQLPVISISAESDDTVSRVRLPVRNNDRRR